MMIDITASIVFTAASASVFELKIRKVFCEEVKRKSGIELPQSAEAGKVSLEFYHEENLREYPEIPELFKDIQESRKEGFRIRIVTAENGRVRVIVLGRDERGEFYGMARILRKLSFHERKLLIPESLDGISITPQYPLRGHQLGYRDKNNTYSAWTIADYERYIRDMALFGANSIELLPPKTDDNLYSAKFKEDPFELMIEASKMIRSYHMDVWLWYPNTGKDYDDPECMYRELRERERIFSSIPYLDAILVPLGDPGSLWPAKAFRVTEEFVRILHKFHPDAKVWVAPQHFQPEPGWYDEFYAEIAKEPDWVEGVCFAPWEQHEIAEMAARLPAKYQHNIRNYPDISHNTNCQFPVPEWDDAFALTEGRESYNARPEGMKYIHNQIEPYTCGAITYSEGIHDDVNKVIWGDQDFDSFVCARETIEDYIRMFIDSELVGPLSEIMMGLEKNWEGPVLKNEHIDEMYRKIQIIDKRVSNRVKKNYRYQMLHLRVLSDYWIRKKYGFDQKKEKEARAVIDEVTEKGSVCVIKEARSLLNECRDHPAAEELLFEMEKLADLLYQTCRIQLTVKRHMGQNWIRGAYLETAGMPLNEYQYLMQSFKRIERLDSEEERAKALQHLNAGRNVGDGNIYCNLGSYEGFSHVTHYRTWKEDPGYLRTPLMDHSIYGLVALFREMDGWYYEFPMPLSWAANATVLYGTPLEVTFDSLDPDAEYELRVFYPHSLQKSVSLMQAPREEMQVHFWAGNCLLADSIPGQGLSEAACWIYDLPKESYSSGTLRLKWQVYGTRKAFAVSEIRIIRK
ncbi:hypothetical protein [Lachnoclostridium sp. Marseille-P6806]|uniref:hypothetical protein n=1 Tax=Lachnoclostridium sp. Marseille-P6806 TaxID=2364793 RepID=UPI00102FC099|nr:hypothetical protein [Lachnoclostridium sp. Marseille-P6806]